MGIKKIKCPSCNENIELDDSREYGFCSYCGAKIQINEHINANETQDQGTLSPGVYWQKAQQCFDTATIDNDNVMEALSYGEMAIESSSLLNRPVVIDKLVHMYSVCIDRLGRELVATIKTYNNNERNSIAIRQTHNVLKTMFVAPNFFQGCSLNAVEELENTSVRVCRSLTGWAKNAAKAFNGNQAYCASVQKMARDMRNTMPTTGYTGGNKPSKAGKKKWWVSFLIVVGAVIGAVVLIAVIIRATGVLPGIWTNNNQKTTSNTNNNSVEKATEKKEEKPKELVVDSSKCWIHDGYVFYTVGINNPNDKFLPNFAHIKVTGTKPDGTIDFSDEWTIGGLAPGSTTYWTNQAGEGNTTKEDSISITVSTDSDAWVKAEPRPSNMYVFDNANATHKSSGGWQVTGEITLTDSDVECGMYNPANPMVVCLLIDPEGEIVGGFSGYILSDLVEGEPYVFDFSTYLNFGGEIDHIELHANPWM